MSFSPMRLQTQGRLGLSVLLNVVCSAANIVPRTPQQVVNEVNDILQVVKGSANKLIS